MIHEAWDCFWLDATNLERRAETLNVMRRDGEVFRPATENVADVDLFLYVFTDAEASKDSHCESQVQSCVDIVYGLKSDRVKAHLVHTVCSHQNRTFLRD